ncbi:hypothetical protein [Serratia phage vB_SspM_LC53]|nr:hypothetical protein [Serratia phage vB_SspM_LC53]
MSHNLENVIQSQREIERNAYEREKAMFESIKTTHSIVFGLKRTHAAIVPAYVAANAIIIQFNCVKSIGEYKDCRLDKINCDFELKSPSPSQIMSAMRFIEAVAKDNGFTTQL